jgi:ferredoxin-NADP reductase
MIHSFAARGRKEELALFHSVTSVEEAAYLEEMNDWRKALPQLIAVPTLTRVVPDGWSGERGRLTGETFKKYLSHPAAAQYLLCGPEGFMRDITAHLISLGVPKTSIHQESFGN